jgi:isopropylmalate/homocitrate/citramalate synthase
MRDPRADLELWLSERGISLGETGFEKALSRVKDSADSTGAVSEGQLRSIVEEAVSGMEVLDDVAASYQ